MPDRLTKEFWGAVFKLDFKGAINAYRNEFNRGVEAVKNSQLGQNYMETNKPMLDAVKEHGVVKGTVKGYQDQLSSLKNSSLVQENIAVAAPFWNAVAEGDLKGAGEAYLMNVKRSHETLVEIGKADSFEGQQAAYQSCKEEVMAEFRENCGEHIKDACEINIELPSSGIDTSRIQTKGNDEVCR